MKSTYIRQEIKSTFLNKINEVAVIGLTFQTIEMKTQV